MAALLQHGANLHGRAGCPLLRGAPCRAAWRRPGALRVVANASNNSSQAQMPQQPRPDPRRQTQYTGGPPQQPQQGQGYNYGPQGQEPSSQWMPPPGPPPPRPGKEPPNGNSATKAWVAAAFILGLGMG